MSKLAKVRIFCEGESDQRFLRDFIKVNYNVDITDEELNNNKYIHNLGGYTKLKDLESRITGEFSDYTSLIFLDADNEKTQEKSGKEASDKFVDDLMQQWNWQNYDKYIFPNNQDNGTIEDFFEKIINEENKGIFDCWEQLKNCLDKSHLGKSHLNVSKKSMIYFYHDVLLSDKNKCKDKKRDFKDTNLWEIDCNKNKYLQKLKSFLDQYIL